MASIKLFLLWLLAGNDALNSLVPLLQFLPRQSESIEDRVKSCNDTFDRFSNLFRSWLQFESTKRIKESKQQIPKCFMWINSKLPAIPNGCHVERLKFENQIKRRQRNEKEKQEKRCKSTSSWLWVYLLPRSVESRDKKKERKETHICIIYVTCMPNEKCRVSGNVKFLHAWSPITANSYDAKLMLVGGRINDDWADFWLRQLQAGSLSNDFICSSNSSQAIGNADGIQLGNV